MSKGISALFEIGRECNAGAISGRGEIRTVFDDGVCRRMLARASLFRESEKSVGFNITTNTGVKRRTLLWSLRWNSDGRRARNVINRVQDAGRRRASVRRYDFFLVLARQERLKEGSSVRRVGI